MSEEATLQLTHDGKSNVLRIHRGVVAGVNSIVVDFCKQLPRNQDEEDAVCLNNRVVSRIAQSTDFVCSHSNCSYHHKSERRYILHARSHFPFEVAPDAVYDTEFKFCKGKYMCSKCPRSTTDWISFREHIRHHIVEKPYKCSLCLIELSSVPELRMHFQKDHFGTQADFVFNGSVYDLNVILSMLLPEASPVTEPLNISFKVPVNTKTRIHCTSPSDETHSVGLMRNLLCDYDAREKQRECDGNDVVDDSSVVKKVPGKYEYSHGVYKCITCCYRTLKEKVFACHAWKHIHGSSRKGNLTCEHKTERKSFSGCPVVNGLLEMLRRVELSRSIDSSRQNSVCETESDSVSQASESLEASSSLVSTAENIDTCLSQPDVQTSMTAGTDPIVHNEECFSEADVTQKSNSGDNILIRHDQIRLKAHCQRCSFTCNSDTQIEIHMKTGHSSVPYKPGNFQCPECSWNTAKKEVFFWHLSHHTGNHSVRYYGCSSCDVEKQRSADVRRHIALSHSNRHLQCTAVVLVENVRYLQNIMKCPECRDGLLWKHIFLQHLREIHGLSDLASYLNANYGGDCPDVISFPSHLLKSRAKNHAKSVTEQTQSSEISAISRFHCENCEFSTNDSDAYWQHQNSHRCLSYKSSSEEIAANTEAALSTGILLDKAKPHRTAKMKAYSQIITPSLVKQIPPLPKQQNQSPKRKQTKPVARKRTASRSEKYSGPYFCRSKNASKTPAASTNVVTKPTSATDNDFFTEFINRLPSSFVFSEDIKCPRCYYSSRVRVNLLRHLKSHETAENTCVASPDGTSRSSDHLSYDLWQPDSSVSSDKSAEEERRATRISELRKKNTSKASHNSLNNTDNASQERTAEVDSFSRSESRDSGSLSGALNSSDDEVDDEMSTQPEILSCEICSEQFDSDVSLERHISRSHGGPYVCHLCGILMWQKNAVCAHYGAVHPGSQLQFEMLNRKAGDGNKEVGGSGVSERKVARVQGIMKETQLLESLCTSSDALAQRKEPDTCAVTASTGIMLSTSSAASEISSTAISEASGGVAAATATAAVDNPMFSVAVTSTTSQLPLYTSSSLPASSTPPSSTLPISLDSLMATLGSMESIAMIASQLVPMLANLDSRMLMQMLQGANPALATALSAYCMPVAGTSGQVPTVSSQTDTARLLNTPGSSAVLQNQVNVPASSQSGPVVTSQSADGAGSDRNSSCVSLQSTAVNSPVALTDSAVSDTQSKQTDTCPSPFDVHRPSSTASTSSSMYSTDSKVGKRRTPLGTVHYTCHLCAFRSSHRTHFAEHLSSEFCILPMAGKEPNGRETARRKRCVHCSFSTYLAEEFDDHVRTHTSSNLYYCTYCDYVGPSSALKLHFGRNHPNKSFVYHDQKSQASSHTSDQSELQAQSVNLDPEVALYDVVSLDHRGIKKLRHRNGIAKINFSGS